MLHRLCTIAVVLCWSVCVLAAEMVSGDPNDPKAWKFAVQQAGAGALKAEEGVLRIDVTGRSNEPWHVEMYQDGKSPLNGRTYVLRFTAKASEPRPIVVAGQVQQRPWNAVTEYTRVEIGTDWKQYTVELPVKDAVEGKVRFPTFQVAERTGTLWLRDISLREAGEPSTPQTSTGSIQTSSATSKAVEHISSADNLASWVLEQHSTAKGVLSAENGILKVGIADGGTERWHVQLYQKGKDIAAGEKYVMKFIAKASEQRKVGLAIQTDEPPYEPLIREEVIEFSTRWQLFTLQFVPEKAVPQHTRMPVLGLGSQAGTVWIRNVSITGPTGTGSASDR